MNHKENFINFMLEKEVLMFGDFTTKSGRKTNYFINTGKYNDGLAIKKLGEFYADCIFKEMEEGRISREIDTIFGPAYKGIPLVISTSIALFDKYGLKVSYTFNRKEEKDHGEGGSLVGYPIKDGDKILIIEDVITAGTAVREIIPTINRYGNICIEGLIVSVDRMEKGKGELTAAEELEKEFGFKTFSIVNLDDIKHILL